MKQKIRVCHVTSVHTGLDNRIFHKECCALSSDFDVTLITTGVPSGERNGVHIVPVTLPKGRFRRQLHLDRVYQTMLQVDADIYHFHDPELMPLGVKIQKCGKRVIFDAHEDVPMQILQKPWIPRPLRKPFSRIYAWREKRLLKRYDALVTVTPVIVDRLRRINPNTHQITNYPIYQEQADKRSWGLSLCYAGNVDPRYLHHELLQAIEHIDVEYRLAGKIIPECNDYWQQLQQMPAWKKVHYCGVMPYEQVHDFLQQSSIGVALLDYLPNVGFKKGSLGVIKFFEFLQAGIPVVATDFEVWQEIVDRYHCGICVNPHDTGAIADAIRYLLEHPEEAKEMGENGKRCVREYYNWESQAKLLREMYHQLADTL